MGGGCSEGRSPAPAPGLKPPHPLCPQPGLKARVRVPVHTRSFLGEVVLPHPPLLWGQGPPPRARGRLSLLSQVPGCSQRSFSWCLVLISQTRGEERRLTRRPGPRGRAGHRPCCALLSWPLCTPCSPRVGRARPGPGQGLSDSVPPRSSWATPGGLQALGKAQTTVQSRSLREDTPPGPRELCPEGDTLSVGL